MTAEEIIRDMMAKKRVARVDLLRGKTHRHMKLRLLTIHLLRQAGFSKSEMCRALNKTREGMTYWLGDEWKEAENSARWRGIADGSGWNAETDSVVFKICNERKIYPSEFFGNGRDKRLTEARREAIRRLAEAGLTKATIARLIKRDHGTVSYWLDPALRERSNRAARASNPRCKQAEMRA